MNPQFEQVQQLGNLWLETVTKMMSSAIATDATQPPPDAARQLRDASLAAAGQQAEQYLRSPQFLAMMKQSLDAQIAFRKQLNQFLTDAHHSVQGVAKADVEALALSIRQMERRVLNRMETLCDRLDALGERLDAMGGSGGSGDDDNDNDDNNGHAGRADDAAPIAAPRADEMGKLGME
jgi:hypothetical protein